MTSQYRSQRCWKTAGLAPASRRGVIRTLAVTGVFLVAVAMGRPSEASAQTSARGRPWGFFPSLVL